VTVHRSRLCHIVIDCDDLDRAAAFWCAVLDATAEGVDPQSGHVYRRLRLPDSDIRVLLQHTTDQKCGKERMHLDLEAEDVEAEVQRLEALGATRWDHQQERGYDFWVLRTRSAASSAYYNRGSRSYWRGDAHGQPTRRPSCRSALRGLDGREQARPYLMCLARTIRRVTCLHERAKKAKNISDCHKLCCSLLP